MFPGSGADKKDTRGLWPEPVIATRTPVYGGYALGEGLGAGRHGGAILAHLSPLLLPYRTESGYRVSGPRGSSQYFGELMVNTDILKNMLLIGNCLPNLSLLESID